MAEFHRKRFEIICDRTEADILAVETLRCIQEATAFLTLLPTRPGAKAWIVFDCKDGTSLKSGELLVDAIHEVLTKDVNR